MLRKRWMIVVCLIAAAAGLAGFRWSASRPHYNLLLITLDTTRADRIGCYGYELAKTPTLDGLAEQGVLFERVYAPAPLTLPAHASMLTGLYPPEHGLHLNGQAALPEDVPTLAGRLKDAGYDTAAFVAAFVLDRRFGLARDFDVYDDDLSLSLPESHAHHRYRQGEHVVNAALPWLRERSERPFFCWVHLYDAHMPYLAHSDRFGEEFIDRPYDAEIAYVDQQIERVLQTRDRMGLRERTIVAVVGDHAESLGDHGERMHGMTLYDSALRVPMIVSLPKDAARTGRVSEPVSLVDFTPTVLDYLGLAPLEEVSGRSLRAAWVGRTLDESPPMYSETDEPYRAARWSPLRALITSRWKFIQTARPELYDLENDPSESVNLIDQQIETADELDVQLAEWIERMRKRSAETVALTPQHRAILESLGYVAGGSSETIDDEELQDVKDMLPYFNMFNDARELAKLGRYELAIPMLRRIVDEVEGYHTAHGFLGLTLMQIGQTDEAIEQLRRCLELDPSSDRIHSALGYALAQKGEYEEAQEELETSLRLNPDSPEAHFHLGLVFEKTDRIDEAIEAFQQSLKLAPQFVPARVRLSDLRNQ